MCLVHSGRGGLIQRAAIGEAAAVISGIAAGNRSAGALDVAGSETPDVVAAPDGAQVRDGFGLVRHNRFNHDLPAAATLRPGEVLQLLCRDALDAGETVQTMTPDGRDAGPRLRPDLGHRPGPDGERQERGPRHDRLPRHRPAAQPARGGHPVQGGREPGDQRNRRHPELARVDDPAPRHRHLMGPDSGRPRRRRAGHGRTLSAHDDWNLRCEPELTR